MDHGADRSRKRAARNAGHLATPPNTVEESYIPGPSKLRGTTNNPKHPLPHSNRRRSPSDHDHLSRANQYKPKAIRNEAALIYSESPFPIPPPRDILAKARRIDLTGSECTDVTWLEGSPITWLNLAGCQIKYGWEIVGHLRQLSGTCFLELPQSVTHDSQS